MGAYTIRVFKAWLAPQNKPWVNTYEVFHRDDPAPGGTVIPAEVKTAAQAIVDAERAMHFDQVYFTRVTASTWLPDTPAYDPSRLWTQPLDVRGTIALGAGTPVETTLDLDVVLVVNRVCGSGRPGRAFYRGGLSEGNVEQQGGQFRIAPADQAAMTARVNAFNTALAAYRTTGANALAIGLIGGKLTKTVVPDPRMPGLTKIKRTYGPPFHTRTIDNFTLGGVTELSREHGYFDRP